MKFLAILSLVAFQASATTVGLNIGSVHLPADSHLNNWNPGAYVITDSKVMIGAYYNSWKRPSVLVAYDVQYGPFDLFVGVVSGYQRKRRPIPCEELGLKFKTCWMDEGWSRGALAPMLVPSVRLPEIAGFIPRVTVLPGFKSSTTIHLSFERSLP